MLASWQVEAVRDAAFCLAERPVAAPLVCLVMRAKVLLRGLLLLFGLLDRHPQVGASSLHREAACEFGVEATFSH